MRFESCLGGSLWLGSVGVWIIERSRGIKFVRVDCLAGMRLGLMFGLEFVGCCSKWVLRSY